MQIVINRPIQSMREQVVPHRNPAPDGFTWLLRPCLLSNLNVFLYNFTTKSLKTKENAAKLTKPEASE